MALTTDQKADVARQWARKFFAEAAVAANFSHTDLNAAAGATDDYIESIQSAYNAALPLPFRSDATLQQKTLMFCWVALKRAGLI
jgi:hypothetical protein